MDKFKELLFQLIPVALGVYIGILAGNWNDDRKHRQNQKMFISNLAKELEDNQSSLLKAHEYHADIGIMADSIFNNSTKEALQISFFNNGGFQDLPEWSGINIPTMQDAVYTTGVNSGLLNGQDFNTASAIGRAYNMQGAFKDLTQPITVKAVNMNDQTSRREVFFLLSLIGNDVAGSEKVIASRLDETIELLKGY